MKKKDILKMHGLTETEFYKLYPTEESYRMAMGGTPFKQFSEKGGQGPVFGEAPDFFNFPYMLFQTGGYPTQQAWEQQMIKQGYKVNPAFAGPNPQYYDPRKYNIQKGVDMENPWLVTDLTTNQPVSLQQGWDQSISQGYTKPVKKPAPITASGAPSWMPAGTSPEGHGLFKKGDAPQGPTYKYINGQYVQVQKMGGAPCFECGGMKQFGGAMSADLQGQYPIFNYGGMDYMYGGDPSLPAISSKESLKMFKNLAKGGQPSFPGQNQQSKLDEIKNEFMSYIRNSTMEAIAREENDKMMSAMFQFGGANPYGYNPNMNNQQAFKDAWQTGKQGFNSAMTNFFDSVNQLNQANQKAQFGKETQDPYGPQYDQFGRVIDPNQTSYMYQDERGNPVTANQAFSPTSKLNVQNMNQPLQQQSQVSKSTRSLEPEANVALAGMSALASAFEQKDARKNMEKWKSMQGADNQFYSMPGNNRGDYDQFGNFRPNQKVPVQFAGQNFGQQGSPYTFQEGGEYYMTDDQINSIIEGGGEIEFLD